MTRKDFILIANTIKELKALDTIFSEQQISLIAKYFCTNLKADNPTFDVDKFQDFINK